MKLAGLLLASVATLGLAPAHGTSSPDAAQAAQRRFVPPGDEFLITRALIKPLSGGKQIAATRSYRVRIVADGDGYRMDGVLVSVEVDAPPFLAAMADAERRRPDIGLFPIKLGQDGTIRDQAPHNFDHASRQEMLEKGSQIYARSEADPARRSEGIQMLGRLASTTPNSPWPADLLYAQPGERRHSRQVTLSDGSVGTVEVVLRVAALLPCGLPQRFERIVTTRLAGTTRVSREVYTIVVPAP